MPSIEDELSSLYGESEKSIEGIDHRDDLIAEYRREIPLLINSLYSLEGCEKLRQQWRIERKIRTLDALELGKEIREKERPKDN